MFAVRHLKLNECLGVEMCSVLITLLGANLNWKERNILAYL